MKSAASKSLVAKKLGIKPGNRIAVLHSPKGYTSILAKLPAEVSMTTRLAGEHFDIVQGFYEDQKSLKADLRKIKKSILPSGKVWICWRKGNVTDLSRDAIWEMGNEIGLDAIASCAIDDNWSAMKLMLPKKQRALIKELQEIKKWPDSLSSHEFNLNSKLSG
ncbi:MAG: hypothetical protein AB7O96_08730 [Pseudobdellovibrionaceae bacterium]